MKDIEEKIGYLKEHICNKDGDKDYLFISYKSTDKELVLGEIVYKLVYDYGLNVYFDGDFDKHNADWIEQFRSNMESPHCKAIITFIDTAYLTSYATLMEVVYSQTAALRSLKPKDQFPIYTVSINNGWAEVLAEEKNEDIGLNKEYIEGNKNLTAEKENKQLNTDIDALDELLRKEIRKLYYEKAKLKKGNCYKIFEILLKGRREVKYKDENTLRDFYTMIFGDVESVFSKKIDTKDIKTVKHEQEYIEKPVDSVLKSGKKKSYGTYDFMLYGEKYENYKLKNVLITTFKEVINKNLDKLDILINQINCLQEGDVLKNKEYSSVFRAGEVVKFNGKEVTIGTSLNKEAVFNYINKLIELCGEDKEIFKDMTSSGTGEYPKVCVNLQTDVR